MLGKAWSGLVIDDWLCGSLGALVGLPLLSEQGQDEMWLERLEFISVCLEHRS